MAINTPRNGAAGFGEESALGTPVSRDVWRPAISLNPALVTASSNLPDLYRSGAGSALRHSIDSREFSDRVDLIASYSRIGLLLKHMIGDVSTAGPSGSDYTHTYDPAALPVGLTYEAIRGSNAKSELAVGCQIADWTFSSSTSQRRATLSVNLFGQDSTRPTKGSPSYGASDDPILHHHIGTVAWNSLNPKPSSVRITGNNGLERVWTDAVTCEGYVESGDRVYGAVLTIYDRDTAAYYDALKAQTESDLSIPYATGDFEFNWLLRNARIVAISEPVRSGGALTREITFSAVADSSDEALGLDVVNTNSSGIAN